MNSPGASGRQPPFFVRARRRRRALSSLDALDRRLREAVGEAEVLARAVEQLRVLLVDDRAGPRRSMPVAAARASASASASSTLRVDRQQHVRLAACRGRSPSARARSAPMSPSLSARAAMPSRNSVENVSRTASGTPSARSPAAVNATLSVGRARLAPSPGSAVVTRSSSVAQPARGRAPRRRSATNTYEVQSYSLP